MALFLAIIELFVAFFTLDGIVPGGWRKNFLVLLLFPIFLLLFLAIRLDGLIKAGQSGGFAVALLYLFGLTFIVAGFFSSGSLGLHL